MICKIRLNEILWKYFVQNFIVLGKTNSTLHLQTDNISHTTKNYQCCVYTCSYNVVLFEVRYLFCDQSKTKAGGEFLLE